VSSRTQRRVNVGLVSVGEARKKHFAHTLETCLSRLRSDDIVTPRTRTWSLASTVYVPSCSDGPPLPNGVCPHLEPTQTSSVFSLFSLSLLANIQRLTSVRQCSSLMAANDISSRQHFKYSCVSSAYACKLKFTSCFFFFYYSTGWAKLNGVNAVSFVAVKHVLENFDNVWQLK